MAALTPTITLGSASGYVGMSNLTFAETGGRAWVNLFGGGSPFGNVNVNDGTHNPLTQTITSATNIALTYTWGSASVNFTVMGDQTVRINGTITNTSAAALGNVQFQLNKIAFPGVAAFPSLPLMPNLPCTGTPGFYAIDGSGTVSGSTFTNYFCFTDFGGWPGNIHMGTINNGSNAFYADQATIPIGTTTFDFRYNFFTTQAEIVTASNNANATFAVNFPRVSQYNDTRPVGQVYLSTGTGASGYYNYLQWKAATVYTIGDVIYYSGQWYSRLTNGATSGTPAADTTNWAVAASGTPLFVATNPWNKNPNGWFGDSTIDVTTAAGVTSLTNRFLSLAAQIVINIGPPTGSQGMAGGSQGILVWDITGERYQQGPVEYLGHPSFIATYAPEMDGTGPGQSGSGHGIADVFMAYFTSRGYRVGVTLRANQLNIASPGNVASTGGSPYIQAAYTSNAAAYTDMNNEVTNAKTRWGCTLFYVDSNPPSLYPAFQQLQAAHTDCLIAPESADQNDLVNWAYENPYQHGKFVSGVRNGITVPGYALNVYPAAQCLIDMADCYEPPRTGTTLVTVNPTLMNSVRAGNILMFRAWWTGGPEYPLLQDCYAQLKASGWSGFTGTDTLYDQTFVYDSTSLYDTDSTAPPATYSISGFWNVYGTVNPTIPVPPGAAGAGLMVVDMILLKKFRKSIRF